MAAPQKALSTLRTVVRYHVDEATASFWSNARVNAAINHAKDRVWAMARSVKDDYFTVIRTSGDGSLTILGDSYAASNMAFAASTRTYTLPPDFSELRLVEVTTSGYETVRVLLTDMTNPRMRAAMEIVEAQEPSVIYADILGERTLRMAPLINRALDTRVTYVRLLADLSADADTLEMPDALYLAVEYYATAELLMQDRDPNAAAWEARARSVVSEFLGAQARQSQDLVLVRDVFGAW